MSRESRLNRAQEIIVRTFISDAKAVELALPNEWVMLLYDMMGYKVAPNGALVPKDMVLIMPYNTVIADYWEDEYDSDGEAFIGTDVDADTSASEQTEGN